MIWPQDLCLTVVQSPPELKKCYFTTVRMTLNNETGTKYWMKLPKKKKKKKSASSRRWPLRLFIQKHISSSVQFSSVTQSCLTLYDSMDCSTPGPPRPSPTSGVYSNSCPLSRWCHITTSSSVFPFSSHLQSFPALGSFQMSQLFTSGGQSIEVSASTSVLPMNIQDWFPLTWTGWISLQSKGLSRVFSNTTVQKHQFFSVQLSLWSKSHIHTWPLEKS